MRKFFASRWAPVFAYLVIVVALVFYLDKRDAAEREQTYKDQVAACERGNAIRDENNRRAVFHQKDLDALRSFLNGAKDARQAAYDRDQNKEDLKAVENYQANIKSLQGISFKQVPLVDCANQFEKP